MNDIEILAGAPEGATHVLEDHEYRETYAKRYPETLQWFWYFPKTGDWFEMGLVPQQNVRSLADIQRIVDLEDELEIHKENTSLIEGLSEYMVKRGISRTGKNSTTEIVRFYEKLEARITDLRNFTDFQRGVITDAAKGNEVKNSKTMCINCEEPEVSNNLCACCGWLQKEGKYEVKS